MKKTVLITGASSGIGMATAKLFASHSFDLIITGRRQELLENLALEIRELYGVDVMPLVFDIRDFNACELAIKSIPNDRMKHLEILINNAGLAKGLHDIEEGLLEHWETMIDTNVKGLLYMTRLISPIFVEKGRGHIINICSTAGKEVYPKGAVYCASKHAVDALTKGMRQDLYTKGIRVSQVSPGHVEETQFAQVRFDGDTERAKIYNEFQPLKAADVANAIYFIASQPSYVNIQDILLMGSQQAGSMLIDKSGRGKWKSK
jgi:NADP-dependent 3-hydroxy acid dehydrogenase YdfG